MTSQRYARPLRHSAVLSFFLLFSCDGASNSTRTGSESHFTCEDDADCPDGRCENDYCVFENESSNESNDALSSDGPDAAATASDSDGTSGDAGGNENGSGGNAPLTSDLTSAGGASSPAGNGGTPGLGGDAGSQASGGSGGSGATNNGGASGSAGSSSLPAAAPIVFRIVNQTDTTVYIDGNRPLVGEGEAPGSEFAMEPLGCTLGCDELPESGDCCVQCDQEWPRVVPLEPGASYDTSWDGNLFTRNVGSCSMCQCQDRLPIAPGGYAARVTAYADIQCIVEPCGPEPDGKIGGVMGSGANLDFRSTFSVPSESSVVVVEITAAPESSGKSNGEDCELNAECASNVCYSGEPMGGVLPQRTCNDCLPEFVYASWCDEDADCCDGRRCGAGELAGLCVE
jgi:hypothetical protein